MALRTSLVLTPKPRSRNRNCPPPYRGQTHGLEGEKGESSLRPRSTSHQATRDHRASRQKTRPVRDHSEPPTEARPLSKRPKLATHPLSQLIRALVGAALCQLATGRLWSARRGHPCPLRRTTLTCPHPTQGKAPLPPTP